MVEICVSQANAATHGRGLVGKEAKPSVDVCFAVEVPDDVADLGEKGGEVRLVGSAAELGEWIPTSGIAMRGAGPSGTRLWVADTALPVQPDALIEFKFVVVSPGGGVAWESGPNRCLAVTGGGCVLSRFGSRGESPCSERLLSLAGAFVHFQVSCTLTEPGDELRVVGISAALGAGDVCHGLALCTSASIYPAWRGVARLPTHALEAGTSWRAVIRRANGSLVWEPIEERMLAVQSEPSPFAFHNVCAQFGVRSHDDDVSSLAPAEPLAAMSHCRPSIGAMRMRRQPSCISTCSTADSRLSMLDCWAEPSTPWLWSAGLRVAKGEGRCEDAYFAEPFACGVADGVGSLTAFASHGINCAAYASELMELASAALRGAGGVSPQASDGAEGSGAAAAIAAAEAGATTYGASTVTVVQMVGSVLDAASLGDSGFVLLRQDPSGGFTVVGRSKSQQHKFNCPYQLQRFPPSIQAKLPPGARCDTASDAQKLRMPTSPGDLVILYSDGLVDNLHEHEILSLVNRAVAGSDIASSPPHPSRVAYDLACAAWERATDTKADTPFAQEARENGAPKYRGGKVDDITVVAAWVMQSSLATPTHSTDSDP